jgi:hypothetical protein
MVSVGLTSGKKPYAVLSWRQCVAVAHLDGAAAKRNRRQNVRRFTNWQEVDWRALLTVLLDTRRTQAGKAVLVDGILPGEEFLDGQRITAARLFERQ